MLAEDLDLVTYEGILKGVEFIREAMQLVSEIGGLQLQIVHVSLVSAGSSIVHIGAHRRSVTVTLHQWVKDGQVFVLLVLR